MAHDNFPPLNCVNIPAYEVKDSCVLLENLKLDPESNNNWLIEQQEAGATIVAMALHFNPRFDAWEVFIVFSEAWDEQKE